MRWSRTFSCLLAVMFLAAGLLADDTQSTNSIATTPPVFVPDVSHMNDPLPDGVIAWNNIFQTLDVPAGQDKAHFDFDFTNVSTGSIVIFTVHPSCGCTTAELPGLPWTIPAGTNEKFGATVDVAGKSGTLIKTINVTTDKGSKTLTLRINMLPPVIPTMTDEARARGVEMAKADRQAVFKGDCASCHVKPAEGKYGQALYEKACGICHEGEHRATMVPDLHALKTPTTREFWQAWIAHGKPGSLMPAFSTADGGPLSDMQIASLAAYLDSAIPSHASATTQ